MDINILVPGFGAIFFGTLISLVAYRIIGTNFTHQDFINWLENRKSFHKVLGPALILIGIAILIFK